MIIPALILIINIDLILDLWLVEVPKYANVFCQIILVCSILDATTGPYYCGIMATGKIRNYQLAISLSFISDIVLVYLVLQNGISPQYVLFPRIITRGILNGLIGLISLTKLLHFKISVYLKRTILPIIMQLSVLTPCMIILYNTLHYWNLFIFSSIIIKPSHPLFLFPLPFNPHRDIRRRQDVQRLPDAHFPQFPHVVQSRRIRNETGSERQNLHGLRDGIGRRTGRVAHNGDGLAREGVDERRLPRVPQSEERDMDAVSPRCLIELRH